MPAVQRSEFYLALNQVATERGVSVDVVLDSVKNAILAAYRKDHPDVVIEEYSVTINPSTGEARVLHQDVDVTPPGFGRIAAQTAKQVILQKVREEEKSAVLSDYKLRIGTVMNGMVLRFAGPNVIVDLGKIEAIMPPHEQIEAEQYHMNQRLSVYLVEIKEGLRGQELIVSRSHKGLLEGLFRREVPEIAQGTVIIKGIAREAGVRSKIAVMATQGGIDPVGSCVGQKGVRVQAVIQEFNGIEKIDVIPYQEDPIMYVGLSLSPAKDLVVTLDEEKKLATVAVIKEELSSAIGKEGQNVRLASQLTGYEIKIIEKEPAAGTVPAATTAPTVASSTVVADDVKTEPARNAVAEVTAGGEAKPEQVEVTPETVDASKEEEKTEETVKEDEKKESLDATPAVETANDAEKSTEETPVTASEETPKEEAPKIEAEEKTA